MEEDHKLRNHLEKKLEIAYNMVYHLDNLHYNLKNFGQNLAEGCKCCPEWIADMFTKE